MSKQDLINYQVDTIGKAKHEIGLINMLPDELFDTYKVMVHRHKNYSTLSLRPYSQFEQKNPAKLDRHACLNLMNKMLPPMRLGWLIHNNTRYVQPLIDDTWEMMWKVDKESGQHHEGEEIAPFTYEMEFGHGWSSTTLVWYTELYGHVLRVKVNMNADHGRWYPKQQEKYGRVFTYDYDSQPGLNNCFDNRLSKGWVQDKSKGASHTYIWYLTPEWELLLHEDGAFQL